MIDRGRRDGRAGPRAACGAGVPGFHTPAKHKCLHRTSRRRTMRARRLDGGHSRGANRDCGSRPMDQPDSFAGLMARLRTGDDGATTEIFRRFAARLIALARTQLDALTRRKEDPEDVVQSVYKSFFIRYAAGEFLVATWDELWSLLTVITVRKCANRNKHFRARRRDAAKERSTTHHPNDLDLLDRALDREATPDEAVILRETIEQMLRGLDLEDRAVVELSMQGYTAREIGDRLGLAERTVGRVRARVKDRLRRMISAED